MSTAPTATDALPELLSDTVAADPNAFYAQLRATDPVHFDPSVNAYLVSRHEDVAVAYRDPAFSTRNYEKTLEPVFGRSLLQMDGTEHAKKRALVTPHFRGRRLQEWEPVILRNAASIVEESVHRQADALVRTFEPGREVELMADFAYYLPVYVIADMLGLPHEDFPSFFRWYNSHIDFLSNLGGDQQVHDAGIQATRELREYLAPVVAERRRAPGGDLISTLITAEVDGESLDDQEIMTHVTQLLNAGSETTGKTIGNLFAHLLADRARYEAVRQDRDLVMPAIAETLRLTPPSQLNGRLLVEDIELGGTPLSSGDSVLLLIASANRDERRFRDPDEFVLGRDDLDPDRVFTSVGEVFTFGHGRHHCLGAMLARSELLLTANLLMDRFPDMALAEGFVARFEGLKMRAVSELRVAL